MRAMRDRRCGGDAGQEAMRDRGDAGQTRRCGTDEITTEWMSRVLREARLNVV
jgi:hypothetical protein